MKQFGAERYKRAKVHLVDLAGFVPSFFHYRLKVPGQWVDEEVQLAPG